MKMKNKISLFKPKVPRTIKKLSWTQAKARFPNMNPDGDVDKDRLKNKFDCKPFDRMKQGEEHEEMAIGFDHIKSLNTIGDVQKLEDSILRDLKK